MTRKIGESYEGTKCQVAAGADDDDDNNDGDDDDADDNDNYNDNDNDDDVNSCCKNAKRMTHSNSTRKFVAEQRKDRQKTRNVQL